MTDLTPIIGAFRIQANFCGNSGSPFSALVLETIAGRIAAGPPYGGFLEPWFDAPQGKLFADAMPLRLIGAFHYLALSGTAPALTMLYPPETDAPDPLRLDAALAEAAETHAETIGAIMASPPQTNEVARSLCLVGGFLTVARETGLPLRCLELGASAGLNMNWDRFGYRFGDDGRWGDPAATVQLYGDWRGDSPPLTAVRVVERAACDQNPIDVTDDDWALRLQSYIWPDQTLRLERLRAAIALKRQTGDVPEKADAGDWTEAHAHPKPGVATVIYHSVFLQYPPRETQARIRAAIAAGGAAATPDAPLAWLSMEPNPEDMAGPFEILLTLWPTGEQRRLATVHPHGAYVNWLA
jgi:hypothetical protein